MPQQALFLMNSPLVIEQVRSVVNRDAFQNAASDEARIRCLYELFFQRPPTDEEIRAGKAFIQGFQPGAAAAQTAAAPAGPRGFGQGARGQQAPGRGRLGAAGRGGGQPSPVRLPLSGWQEYAHALLLTNEAAFVNCPCLVASGFSRKSVKPRKPRRLVWRGQVHEEELSMVL